MELFESINELIESESSDLAAISSANEYWSDSNGSPAQRRKDNHNIEHMPYAGQPSNSVVIPYEQEKMFRDLFKKNEFIQGEFQKEKFLRERGEL